MVVTEIACLSILPNASIDDSDLRSKLSHARDIMQSFSGRSFYYFQQVEDSSKIYIIGEWTSLNQHMNDFIPSSENQALLEGLKNYIGVDWLQHIDAAHVNLPLPKDAASKQEAIRSERNWNITNFFTKAGQRGRLAQEIDTASKQPASHDIERKLQGGWRVDKPGDHDEYVSISATKNTPEEAKSVWNEATNKQSEEGREEVLDRIEVAHMRLLDI